MFKPICFFILLHICTAPPVKPPAEQDTSAEKDPITGLEYHRYLSEIMQELESDEEFKKRVGEITNITQETGLFAQQLDFVNHNIRSKLDEIKRREVTRLNDLEYELKRAQMIKEGKKNLPPGHHLDPELEEQLKKLEAQRNKGHVNHDTESFEVEDLQKLIEKALTDLNIVDKKEEDEFKKYEMEKEAKHRAEIKKEKDPEKKKQIEEKFNESKKRHKQHDKLHEPGSQEQIKEVWQEEDHLDKEEFNPHTFFSLHDTNDDGHLDQNEIEALFQSELDKVYNASDSDDDMNERYHEMHRMRKHLVKKIDTNKDGMISKEEFIHYMKSRDSEEDSEWKTEEESDEKPYSAEEYQHYEEEYRQKHPDMFPTEDDNGNLVYKPRDSQRTPEDHSNKAPEDHPNKAPEDHPNKAPEDHPNKENHDNKNKPVVNVNAPNPPQPSAVPQQHQPPKPNNPKV